MKLEGLLVGSMIAATSLLTGCAASSGARAEPVPAATAGSTATAATGRHRMGRPSMGMMAGMCPMAVKGTTVKTEDVDGGIALEFTTSTGDVADLRRRVRHMAEMHEHHDQRMMSGRGSGGCGCMMGGQGMTGGKMKMTPSTASAEDIEGGARLVLRPKDPEQLEVLRGHVRLHSLHMAEGGCPMMSPASGEKAAEPSQAK
jgi:hypothetical protein